MPITVDITKNELVPFVEQFLNSLSRGEKALVLGLSGDLGAGKTTFTQTLAQLLGVAETVQSPTFVVMKRYNTQHHTFKKLIHIDAYRLHSGQELLSLGFNNWKKDPETIIVIEWPEQVGDTITPTEHLMFNHADNENIREVKRIII